jgi:hypothetical protein
MNKLFPEFENENALRWYPFASGCTGADTSGSRIGTGVLVDAALYQVNPNGALYLSRIGADGVVSISDAASVVMTATAVRGASTLEFYDASDLHRHVGTLVASSPDALSSLVNVYEDRVFRREETTFASSCVFPVVNDGVLSVDVGRTGAADGTVRFLNGPTDVVRVSAGDGSKLRFDVIPRPREVQLDSIKHVYCIVDGKTPFRIMKLPFGDRPSGLGNTVAVYLDNIDRQDVCADAHREDSLETRDTCGCQDDPGGCRPDVDPPVDIPDAYQVEVVDIPNGADGAFYLAVPNMAGYDNPLSLTLNDDVSQPSVQVVGGDGSAGISITGTTSKGVVLQVPGLEAK